MKLYRIDEYGNAGAIWFDDAASAEPRKYVTGSADGALHPLRFTHKDLAGVYVAIVDADGALKQRDPNAMATMLTGVPVYGRALVFRWVDDHAAVITNADAHYLNRIVREVGGAGWYGQIVEKKRKPRRKAAAK